MGSINSFKILLPYTLRFLSATEIFCVNTLGFPFNFGILIGGIILAIGFYVALYYTRKKEFFNLNTIIVCVLFIFIGFSSWSMLPIRASAGTVINENDPSNMRKLLGYYNLEQYPSIPLVYGPMFTEIYSHLDPDTPYKDGKPVYEKDTKTQKYSIIHDGKNAKQNLDDNHKSFFPRMWSHDHIANYMQFTGPILFTIKPQYQDQKELLNIVSRIRKDYNQGKLDNEDYDKFLKEFGTYLNIQKPSLWNNIQYLFEYQIGYMYWRYFMWNFVGKQNNVQGKMDTINGNWLSGIKFIDQLRLGSQENLPSIALKNKARNTYYFLPLILGLIGFIFQLQKDKKNFWVAIWIGFGIYAMYTFIKLKIPSKLALSFVIIISMVSVPGVLAYQNWDDHDRSNRYAANTLPKMYLSSCQENAILFTIGDNDTFGIWYAQEIENYRTDVRTIVAGYLTTDWYIDQMKKQAYKSAPLPISLSHDFYQFGKNDMIYYKPVTKDTMNIKNWIHWIKSNDPRTKGDLLSGEKANTFPTKHIRIPVDKESVLRNGIVAPKDADKIVPYIDIHLKGDYLLKHRLVMLDIIANNNWERPIHFSGGSFGDDDYLWMKDYLQLDGLTYKLVPIKTEVNPQNPYEYGSINTKLMYPMVMQWDWQNMENPKIYREPVTQRNSISLRISLGRLALTLIEEDKNEKAKKILDLGMKKMPLQHYNTFYTPLKKFILGYFKINEKEKARDIWSKVVKNYQEQLHYYGSLSVSNQYNHLQDIILNIEYYKDMIQLLTDNDNAERVSLKTEEFNDYLRLFKSLYHN